MNLSYTGLLKKSGRGSINNNFYVHNDPRSSKSLRGVKDIFRNKKKINQSADFKCRVKKETAALC